jgi:PPP family 3-phenylpropionic acid transporter
VNISFERWRQTANRTARFDDRWSPSARSIKVVRPLSIPGPIAFILLYVVLYGAFGVASPFWPKFFETKSLVPQQISEILAAAMLARLVSGPLVGYLADQLGSLRLVLAGCAVLSAIAVFAFLWADTFWLLLVVALFQAAALAPTTSIADALSVNLASPRVAERLEYGWLRGSASAAFVVGTLTVGQLISPSDLSPVIWMNVSLLLATAVATTLLPGVASRASLQLDARSFPLQEMKALLGTSQYRMVLFVSALVFGSHAVHDAFAVIRWNDAGVSTSAISFLWSEAVIAEVFVFLIVGPALIERFGARGAALLAATAGVVRWSLAGVTTSVLLLSLVQPLHGLTFALLHLACMRMMGGHCPDARRRFCASSLRVWLRGRDGCTDFLFGDAVCLVCRSGVLPHGSPVRCGTPICLVWLRRRKGSI